jgi:dihydrofolate reductase
MISIIAAITDKHRAIGVGGKLLFPISEDLKRFKQLTTGHPVVMGRKTFQSIGKILPNRTNIVITRNESFRPDGPVISPSIEEALDHAKTIEKTSGNDPQEIFIIGGGEIYTQALEFSDRLYLTIIRSDAKGDVHFPDYADFSKEISREDKVDEKTGLKFSWVTLER